MSKQLVDRTANLNGINRAVRDFRIPASFPRGLENFSLPDGKARHRSGYQPLNPQSVKTQALAKATGTQFAKRLTESDHNKGILAVTPLSYALLRWESDFQLRTTEAKTLEFTLRLGDLEQLVANPFTRIANRAGAWTNYTLRPAGVYVFDQTILSNNHIFNTGSLTSGGTAAGTKYDLSAFLAADQFDVFPTTTLAILYAQGYIKVVYGMVENAGANTGQYWHGTLTYNIGTYTEGDIYHIAVVNDPAASATGRITLYVNGVQADFKNLPGGNFVYAGQWDKINGITYASGQHRDIVLLNECTVRASYSSACKIRADMHGHQTFFHDFSSSPDTGILPWALSPPRGTAMCDLRIWSTARSSAQVLASNRKRLDVEANLIGHWYLNDGSSVCFSRPHTNRKSYISLHHGYSGYIPLQISSGTVPAILIRDGQHIIKRTTAQDRYFGSGLAAGLDKLFDDYNSAAAALAHKEQNSFTVQMRVMVDAPFQQELNADNAAALNLRDIQLVETRYNTGTGATPYDALLDGNAEASASARNFIGHATDPVPGPDIKQPLRAYDQTLWSIEGTQETSSENVTDEPDNRRILIARGVLTPAGKVGFELVKAQTGGAQPKYCRLLSGTALTVGVVYTITFVQRANYVYDAITNKLDASGWKMEIWLQADSDANATLSNSYVFVAASTVTTFPCIHNNNYDISIGASYVNDGWDTSVRMPFPAGVVAIPKTMYCPAPSATTRGNSGPWPVQQRFMSPYQDQPGFFALSFFRLWSVPLDSGDITRFGKVSISGKDQTPSLLVNLEINEPTGVEIPNKSRYPDSFYLGFKGWGMPQGYRNITYQNPALTAYLTKELYEGTWAYEDCLGYVPIDSVSYSIPFNTTLLTPVAYAKCNGIAPVKTTPGQQYGLLTVFGDAPAYDPQITGAVTPQFVSNHGLMSEFIAGSKRNYVVIGNRTFITGKMSFPKVFDGKTLNVAGFKRWSGGKIVTYPTPSVAASLANGWYGIAVVYFAEKYGTYHVSPISVCRIDTITAVTPNAIGLFMVPQHPDSRVSIVEVYRTLPQATKDLAASAPLYKTRIGAVGSALVPKGIAGPNEFAEQITIDEPDNQLGGAVLDRFVTELPLCSFCAGMNDRLYLAGDPVNRDTIYFTDPGNPERLDSFVNSIKLPESTGDSITGIINAFGSIYVFKPTAIWRIDDVGGNQHQLTKIANIGAVSEQSIQIITSPDDGQVTVFFWSKYGPYLFNGSSPTYIGTPLEEYPTDLTSDKYCWLDSSSVVVAHYPENREIICFYRPIFYVDGNKVETNRNGHAVVFNYRTQGWYKYTGVIGNCATSISATTQQTAITDAPSLNNTSSFLVVGGDNGRAYLWAQNKYDGYDSSLLNLDGYKTIVPLYAEGLNCPTFPFTEDLIGLWITLVYPETNCWISLPIVGYDATQQHVYIDTTWPDCDGFDYQDPVTDPSLSRVPQPKIYLCQAFARIEYPFDEMDIPFFDKDIVEAVTWVGKEYQIRYRWNYKNLVDRVWKLRDDIVNLRDRIQIKVKAEAFKFELASKNVDASLNGVCYTVAPTSGANVKQ